MIGTIEALKFKTDSKKQPYAVATIGGEDIYTWDKGLIDSLKAAGEGLEISYELAERSNDFKFKKFASLETSDEPQARPAVSGWRDEHIRIPGLSEMKFRSKSLEIASMQVESCGLKDADKKKQKTLELYRDYMKTIEAGYESLFDGIRRVRDED
jgi:hypothetical protein